MDNTRNDAAAECIVRQGEGCSMRIVDSSGDVPVQQSCVFVRVAADGSAEELEDALQVEAAVCVFVNGELTMRLMCSADHLVELVLGRLYTEDMISGPDEVDEIRVCEHATRVLVSLKDRKANLGRRHVEEISTCCTFNSTLNGYFTKDEGLEKVVPHPWSPEQVIRAAREFEADTPIHKATFGAHSCYLLKDDGILYCCEDLGRHNAFDKVVGCALRDGIDLAECAVFTSGRIPTDMVVKAIRARVPLLISKAVPTDMTVAMAQEFDLTLVCSAHSDSFKVFNDPLGVVAGECPQEAF
ncbi:formate dehydrogenase accessory sulfurtransferase FdhD [Curtanaerobium respiraculi]|uniref:formate dehydrogenase accessory sulfurtransferase FdhD n=1 Tax=Curtanaerobium respiraculi TaxID=2949669 RepID=UPI0024B3BA91|nr:formate dehydrogenase accessory sulfurtransferase FdhD [Curtanaerobium respiraculi]